MNGFNYVFTLFDDSFSGGRNHFYNFVGQVIQIMFDNKNAML